MALDSTGRPIAVHTPAPPNHKSRALPEQEQFLLVARKLDDALRHLEGLSRRVAVLEVGVEEQLNATLAELRGRFDELMLTRLKDHETRFGLMAETMRSLMEKTRTPPSALSPAPSE
jgi:hypothetical protein